MEPCVSPKLQPSKVNRLLSGSVVNTTPVPFFWPLIEKRSAPGAAFSQMKVFPTTSDACDISLPPGLEVTEGLAMPAFVPVGEPMDLLVCPPAGRGLAVVIRVRAASALCFCCCSCESTLRSTPFGERSARCFVAKSTGWPKEGRRIAGEEAPAREATFAADELPPLCD